MVLDDSFKVLAIIFVVVVLPLLPVTAITFPLNSLMMFLDIFPRARIVFLTYIIFLFFEFKNLLSSVRAITAPFLRASST